MNRLFFDDSVLQQLEREEKWNETLDYITKTKNLKDKEVFLRLAAQTWYILTFFDCCLPKEKIDINECLCLFKSLYNDMLTNWSNDQDCLWLFGYFMSINQNSFEFLDENIFDIEKKGAKLISKAYDINRDNLFVRILHFSDTRHKIRYWYTKKKIKKSLKELFPSNSSVDEYFFAVFV